MKGETNRNGRAGDSAGLEEEMESSSEEGRRLLDVSRVVRGGTIQSEGKGAFALARKGGLFSGLLTSHRSAPVVRLRQQ
jgi:hypothetical protein